MLLITSMQIRPFGFVSLYYPALRPLVALAGLLGPLTARAHFPFSYSGAESIGLVQAALPPNFGVTVTPPSFARSEFDYLRLQPLVAGYAWQYRGTITNTPSRSRLNSRSRWSRLSAAEKVRM
jgi:hypothetical protein